MLHILSYNLNLTAEEYASSYFLLRAYVRKDATTHQNIQTQRRHLVEYVPLNIMIYRSKQQR